MLTPFDHLLALVLALLFPLRARIVMTHRLGRASESELPAARVGTYREAMALQWTLTVATVALWFALKRPWGGLGLIPVLNGGLIGVLAGLVIVALMIVRQSSRGGPDAAAVESLRRRTRNVERMLPRTRRELFVFSLLAITAGICEELLYRGYLIHYLQQLGLALAPAAAVSSVVFGFGHLYQGPRGVLTTTLLGGFLAAVYLLSGSLFAGMLIHALMDLYSGRLFYDVWTRPAPTAPEGAA